MTLKEVGREKKQCIGIRFLPQEFYWFFLLVQSQKNDYFNYDLFKVSKMTYDLFKVSKMTTVFLTWSK